MRIIALILLLISCSPIKRHSRLVKKYPFVHTTDSVKLIDTIRLTTNKVVSDTVVHESLLFDTVIVTKDNLTVKMVKIKDSVYINGECDTVFIDKVIERNIPIKYYKEIKVNWKLILFLLFIIVLLVFSKK